MDFRWPSLCAATPRTAGCETVKELKGERPESPRHDSPKDSRPLGRNKDRTAWPHSRCINTRDGKSYRLDEISRGDIITLGDILCGYIQHAEIKSLGPDSEKCKPYTRGLLRRMTIHGGLQHCIGKEVSRFEQGKDDFIENIDDVCIRYDGGRVAANESLIAEIKERGLRKTTRQTGLDRKTIRAILNGDNVRVSTLAKAVMGMRDAVL
jgi:hypothetical protein